MVFVNRRTLEIERLQAENRWIETFRALYADFWKDDQIAIVRRWITNEQEYSKLAAVLSARIQSDSNTLSPDENDMLEKIDRFCSVLVRIEYFGKTDMPKDRQRKLYELTYRFFWKGKVRQRQELLSYMNKFWDWENI